MKTPALSLQVSSFILHPSSFSLPLAFSLIFLSGCGNEPSGETIRAYALEAQQILERLDAYQEVVTGLAEEIKRDGLITPDQMAKVQSANRMIDDLQSRLAQIATAIGRTEFSGHNTLLDNLEALQVANTAVGPLNPYSGQISLALTGLITVLGLYGNSQRSKRKKAETTAAKIVKSIDKAEVDGVVKLDDVKQDRATEDAVLEILAA